MFGFQGIWQGTALLYDRETNSQWLHLTGECVRGARKGKQLRPISGLHTNWITWRTNHPKTTVMAVDPKFSKEYFDRAVSRRGLDFFPSSFKPTIKSRDNRLRLSSLVYGVTTDSGVIAIPFQHLRQSPSPIVQTPVGETPVVVIFDSLSGSVAGFVARWRGEAVEFALADRQAPTFRAGESVFDFAGRCLSGPGKGERLTGIGMQSEWYGWYAAHPDTEVWGDASRGDATPSGSGLGAHGEQKSSDE